MVDVAWVMVINSMDNLDLLFRCGMDLLFRCGMDLYITLTLFYFCMP